MAAIALSALLAGCEGTADQTSKSSKLGEDADNAQKNKQPYYYGLIEEYQSILAEDPHNLAAIIGLANALYDAGEWKEAIRQYGQALRLDPHNADAVTDMGTCYRNIGMPDQAIRQYEQALRIEPVHQNALFNLGVVYGYDKKDYRRAIEYWDRLLHVSPKHPKAEYLRGSIAQFKQAMAKGTAK